MRNPFSKRYRTLRFFRTHRYTVTLPTLVAIFMLGLFVVRASRSDDVLGSMASVPTVRVARVVDLSLDRTPLPLIGSVRSKSEVIIQAQAQGIVSRIYTAVGRKIRKGALIAELENTSAGATVSQAEGAVAVAQATLLKLQGGTREERLSVLAITRDNAQSLLDEARVGTIKVLNNIFVTADTAVRNQADQFFINPQSDNPQLSFITPNQQLKINIERERFLIEQMLVSWREALTTLTVEGDLFTALSSADAHITALRSFFDSVALTINPLLPSANLSGATIATWQGNVAAARGSVIAAGTMLSQAHDILRTKEASFAIAQKQYEEGVAGERTEDVLAAEGVLKQAQGALLAAQDRLAKTRITTPIAGTVSALYVEQGQFVPLSGTVAFVSNNNALEIVTFITKKDRKHITVGADVLIDELWHGSVTSIAPALDPQKRKIEIIIRVDGSVTDLANGESVRLSVTRTPDLEALVPADISVPLSALKIGFEETFVFSVDDSGLLVSHPVLVGPIVGEKIIIENGITLDLEIVVDARGLREGKEVVIIRE